MSSLRIDVWSDVACPWCYVGKRRLERALAEFPHAADVTVIWRAFELDPGAPKERDRSASHVERIAHKYGLSIAQAKRSTDHLIEIARGEGLAFDFEHIRSGNTFDAHRLIHLGLDRGVQGAVEERFMRACFEEGELLSDHGALVRLGAEAGLDEGESSDVLSGDGYVAEVRADEAEAAELGISGVPCFVLDRRFAVTGAQSSQVMLSALHHAWSDREAVAEVAEGAVCGPEAC